MIRIAITGNIAAGKTAVQKIIEKYGYKVLDTDKAGHELLDQLPEIKQAFKNYDVFSDTGEISREKLGKLVFSDKELKKKLEGIIHPQIRNELIKFFNTNKSEPVIFAGIPLLFESNMRDIFDKVLLIYTDDEIRKKRLLLRNNYTPEYAGIRMKSQIPQEEKKLLSDYIIYNNGTLSDLERSVEKFLTEQTKH